MPTSSEAEKQKAIRKLRKLLEELYTDNTAIMRVVKDAGLPQDNISFSGSASDIWSSVLSEADKNRAVEEILEIAIESYRARESELRDAFDGYYDASAKGRRSDVAAQIKKTDDESQRRLLGLVLDQIQFENNTSNLTFVSLLANQEKLVQFDVSTFHTALKEKLLEWLDLLESERDYRALLRVAIIMIAAIARDLSTSQESKIVDTRYYFRECKEKLINSGLKDPFVDEILECLDSYPRKIFDEKQPESSLL